MLDEVDVALLAVAGLGVLVGLTLNRSRPIATVAFTIAALAGGAFLIKQVLKAPVSMR